MNPGMHFVMVLFVDLHLLRLSKPSTVNSQSGKSLSNKANCRKKRLQMKPHITQHQLYASSHHSARGSTIDQIRPEKPKVRDLILRKGQGLAGSALLWSRFTLELLVNT